jgi:YHS domain-containing protein
MNRTHLTRRSIALLATAALASAYIAGCAATPGRVKVDKPVPALDAPKALAIDGYDAVSYFEMATPTPGSPQYNYRWQGVEWRFASGAHRDSFAASPERYAPQYGNYCAYAVSRGTTAHGDPNVWAIVENKLYLNNNRFAQELWNQDRPGNIVAADQNWPLLPKQPAQ